MRDPLARFIQTLPVFDLEHVKRLTTHVGILQHATYTIPNFHHGYCLDDNSRALILALMANEREPEADHKQLIVTYLSFIHYMQLADGRFCNFFSFGLEYLDDVGSEDSYGRTIWALGYLLQDGHHADLHPLAREIFSRALPHVLSLQSVRAAGYCLLGHLYFLEAYPNASDVQDVASGLATFLESEFEQNSSSDWPWYEKVIAYDNAILPLSLLRAGHSLQVDSWAQTAMKSFDFLDSILFGEGYLTPIGNESWYRQGGPRSIFGQQPLEVTSTIMLYLEVFKVTADMACVERSVTALQWFLGENILDQPLYDLASKGCRDGLERYGINQNQGAESTICFWLAYLYFLKHVGGSSYTGSATV